MVASQTLRPFDLLALHIFDNRVFRREEFSKWPACNDFTYDCSPNLLILIFHRSHNIIGLNVTTVSPNNSQVDGISIAGSRITLPNEVLRFPAQGAQYLTCIQYYYTNCFMVAIANVYVHDCVMNLTPKRCKCILTQNTHHTIKIQETTSYCIMQRMSKSLLSYTII